MGELLQKRMKGKANTNGLDKNPENINNNGRPKKGIALVNAELKEKGYEPATKADIEVNYMALLQLEEQELKLLLEDKTKPMLIRILVKNMLGGKGFDIIEKMLDRGIGKALQKSEIDNNNNNIDITDTLSNEQKKIIANRILNGQRDNSSDTTTK